MSKPTYEELERENAELRRRVGELERQVEKLTRQLEEALRQLKRQAAPFSKGEPKAATKRPGRKVGKRYGKKARREVPARIDEVHEAPLPGACSECGGALAETGVAVQYQTEIPRQPIHRQFNVHVGCCQGCGKRHQGRHPLQTSDALGAAASQLGPDAQAAIVELNKSAGLSHGKIARVFAQLFGISITRGASAQIVARAARRCAPAYEQILQSVRESSVVVLDETGWRIGGRKAWLHVLVGARATGYVVDRTRSGDVAQRILGLDYDGTMIHDGWSVYDRFRDAIHQQCLAHPMRRAREMLEMVPARARAFPRRVLQLFKQSLRTRDQFPKRAAARAGRDATYLQFTNQLERLASARLTDSTNQRFARHLLAHLYEWFAFLADPTLDATNHRAEQAIRPAVVNRKVWGGNRTEAGAQAQSVLASVLETCRRQFITTVDFLSNLLRGQHPTLVLAATTR
jgi:transposase